MKTTLYLCVNKNEKKMKIEIGIHFKGEAEGARFAEYVKSGDHFRSDYGIVAAYGSNVLMSLDINSLVDTLKYIHDNYTIVKSVDVHMD